MISEISLVFPCYIIQLFFSRPSVLLHSCSTFSALPQHFFSISLAVLQHFFSTPSTLFQHSSSTLSPPSALLQHYFSTTPALLQPSFTPSFHDHHSFSPLQHSFSPPPLLKHFFGIPSALPSSSSLLQHSVHRLLIITSCNGVVIAIAFFSSLFFCRFFFLFSQCCQTFFCVLFLPSITLLFV